MTEVARLEFTAVLEQHRGIIFRVANAYAWTLEERADLVQDIALQLWRAWPRYDPARSVTTWMYRIALNVAISQLRRRPATSSRDATPFDETRHVVADINARSQEAREQIRLLQAVIQTLSPLDRALVLLYLEERSTREIAEILGISGSNVTTKISRLKRRIRNDLDVIEPT